MLEKAAAALGRIVPRASRELHDWCRHREFPGNIRELEGLLADAVLRHQGGELSPPDLGVATGEQLAATALNAADPALVDLIARLPQLPTVREAEHLLIQEALHRFGGNQTLAARMLGMSRTTLSKWMRRKA